jgi:hypothetical protein
MEFLSTENIGVVKEMTTLIVREELRRLKPYLRNPLEVHISDLSISNRTSIPIYGIDMDIPGVLEPSHFRSTSWSLMDRVCEGDSLQTISAAFAGTILQDFNEWLIRCNHSFLRHVQIYLDKMEVLVDNPEIVPDWIRQGNSNGLWEYFEFLVAKDYLNN